jgi:diguanylate cyclase (GGDEF)-like protein
VEGAAPVCLVAVDDLVGRRVLAERTAGVAAVGICSTDDAVARERLVAAGADVCLMASEIDAVTLGAALRAAEQVAALRGRLRAVEEELERQAAVLTALRETDPLTELPSRDVLLHRIQRAIDRASATGRVGFAIVAVRLDDWEAWLDRLGERGTHLLVAAAAERLSDCTRIGDLLARSDEDTFLVLVERSDAVHEAAILRRRAVGALNDGVSVDREWISVGVSTAVVAGTPDLERVDDVLRAARELLRRGQALRAA